MPNINDFKLVVLKSRKYFDFLGSVTDLDSVEVNEKSKERFGFYLFMLENLCGIKETSDLVELITDTEFNSLFFNKKFDDCGIDAVDINEEKFEINLFNFKYREKFNTNKKQSINETILSTKFISALLNENIDPLEGKLKIKAKNILDKLIKTNDIWKLNLYVISNEFIELDKAGHHLKQLEDVYNLEVIPVGLPYISKMMSIRPNPVNCELVVEKDAILSFSESSISSSKSYILRLLISELVRITCDDSDLRTKYNIEDYSPLAKKDIDYSILFDNVRGLVLRSKINPNISKSLKEEASRFFLYNNGVTIVANDVVAEPINANKKVKLKITNFQVLNGGQTLRTIHAYNKEDDQNINNNLANSEILVRVFKTTPDSNLTNKIAEYTNSQNSISIIDLKSLSAEQIQLEQFLDEHNIIYSRKMGDTGLHINKVYSHRISMERFGQILYSLMGNPHKATNQKKHIFDRFYDDVFGEDNFQITESPRLIKKYFEIKRAYDNHENGYNSSDQKVFFILYLESKSGGDILTLIDSFEEKLKSFVPESGKKTTSEARKLLLLTFKEYLDKEFNI